MARTREKENEGNMDYPIELKVRYPERLSRLTTLFRIFMVIPQAIVLYFIASTSS